MMTFTADMVRCVMSRYIDADFEIAHYTSMTTNPTPDVTEKDKRNSLVILDALRMAKTIDIVRCKECKHREKYPCDEIEFYECGHLRLHGTKVGVKDDFFCADGERREP